MQRINSQMLISHAISILKATLHFKQNQVMHLHNICLPTIFRPRLLVLTETRGGWGLACRAVPCRAGSSAQRRSCCLLQQEEKHTEQEHLVAPAL